MNFKFKSVYNISSFKIGFWIFCCLFVITIISFFWTPNNPNTSFDNILGNNLISLPSLQFPLGTDYLGRCVLSRIMISFRSVFFIGILSMIISFFVGSILGFLCGYFGNKIDSFFMLFINIFNGIPDILLMLVFISIFGTGVKVLIVTIGILGFAQIARIIRGAVMESKNNEYILWAKSIGVSHIRIITHHIFIDIFPIMMSTVAIRFSTVVLIESGLSYLGFTSPDRISLGRMLFEAGSYIFTNPFYAFVPGFFIVLIVLSSNMISNGVENAFNNHN